MSASLTNLCPSNFLRSNYQTHSLHNIQITVTKISYYFFLNVYKKELTVCIERKRIKQKKSINELV